jgi:protein-disulfide isomerase
VRYVSRDLPLSDMHPYAARAAEGARCAGDQGKYWEFRDAMLENPSLNADTIADSAKSLVPNAASFRACLESEKYAKAVLADADEAASLQIRGTPTFVVARSDKNALDGIRVDGAQSYHAFQQRIDELLKR